jgi:hypothetical protein
MQLNKVITVYIKTYIKIFNTLCGQTTQLLLNVNLSGTYGYYCALKG